jgi:hypothetical protein
VNPVDAAVSVAREHGLRVDEPRVLREVHNLAVHLSSWKRIQWLRPNAR